MATMQMPLQKTLAVRTPQRQSVRALLGASKIRQPSADMHLKSDYRTGESFTNLRLTAEKMMQEQASAKTDLQMTHAKLRKSEDQIRALETKLQDVTNENAMLKVKQQEDSKLWKGLDSKFALTRSFCDQLTETLEHLAIQVQEAESSKLSLEEKLAERLKFYTDIKKQIDEMCCSNKLVEETAKKWEENYVELKQQQDVLSDSFSMEVDKCEKLSLEKAELEKQLDAAKRSIEDETAASMCLQRQLDDVQKTWTQCIIELKVAQEQQIELVKSKGEADIREKELKDQLFVLADKNNALQRENELLATRVKELEQANAIAAGNMEKLLLETTRCNELAQDEKVAKTKALEDLQELRLQYREVISLRDDLQSRIDELKKEVFELNRNNDMMLKASAEKEQALKVDLEVAEQRINQLLEEKFTLEKMVQGSEDKMSTLLKDISEAQGQKEEMAVLISQLKAEIIGANKKIEQVFQEKSNEIQTLQSKLAANAESLNLLEIENKQLHQTCLERSCLLEQMLEKQKCMEEQNTEILAKMAGAEQITLEIRKQAETQLEAKQAELQKHIREISQRNDQEMTDMRRKYEAETKEAMAKEEQKARLLLLTAKQEYELERTKWQENQKIQEEQYQAHVKELLKIHEKEKHELSVLCTEEVNKKEQELMSKLAEDNLNREKEFSTKIDDLHRQYQLELKKIQTEQKTRHTQDEEATVSLEQQVEDLREQLKKEKLKKEEDVKKSEEAVSKKESESKLLEEKHQKSVLAMKASFEKDLDEMKKSVLFWELRCKGLENQQVKDVRGKDKRQLLQDNSASSIRKLANLGQPSPVNQGIALEKACLITDKGKPGMPTHSKTVTQHEYEVATSDGRKTITKRKRTKSMVTFGEQASTAEVNIKKMTGRQKTRISAQQNKVYPKRLSAQQNKQSAHGYRSPMSDLFASRSLDPYVDDPYAFD